MVELSGKEREQFRLFVSSPYFNLHKKTTEFLEIILKQLDNSKSDLLEKEKIFKKLFPKDPYEEQKIHNLMSGLKKLLLRFLAMQQYESKEHVEEIYAMEWAYKRNQFELLTNRAKQLEKKLDQEWVQKTELTFAKYRLNYLMGYYGGQFVDRSKSDTMQRMLDYLDGYYLEEKLRNACHLTAHKILVNANYDFGLLPELLVFIENHPHLLAENKVVALYYTILKSLRDDHNPQYYLALKEMLGNLELNLSPQDRQDLYSFSYNYCISKINKGDKTYQRELFELYQKGLAGGDLLNNGIINEWDYKNITTLGCSLKEFSWTENFIEEFKEVLPAHRKENAYLYNLGNLFYHKKLFDEAISALIRVQFTDITYHLNTTFLMLRTYHAKRDTDALLSLIDTFRIYIMRNTHINTEQKKGYTNFLRFTRKMVMIKHQMEFLEAKKVSEQLNLLLEQIRGTENIINKFWLEEECTIREDFN
jgi:hypothetical protein